MNVAMSSKFPNPNPAFMLKYKQLPIYGQIIYITVCVFALTQLWRLVCLLFVVSGYHWQSFLALPANLNDFWLRPWTLFTYMFCHADIGKNVFHIIFNMLWLWWFGQMFVRFHTSCQLLSLYLVGGLFAGLFFLLVYNVFPYFLLERQSACVVGASGALMALMGAVVMQPSQMVGLNLIVRTVPMQMRTLTIIVMALTLFNGTADNSGGLVCHIGGALFGLIYGHYYQKGRDITAFANRWIQAVKQWIHQLRRPRMTAMRGGRRDPIGAEKMRDMNYNADRRQHEAQIDAILDKISKHGYDGLSTEEKQMLFDASKKRNK